MIVSLILKAYMAPEVFMKSEGSGHGRAADIWSMGCCIIEMASGRRPWSDYDSNYQIMFKVIAIKCIIIILKIILMKTIKSY